MLPNSDRTTVASYEEPDNFKGFFQAIDDMIFVGSTDGKILFSNRAASQKLGYTTEELKSMSLIDLHPPEMKRKTEDIVGLILRGERESCPLPLKTKSGYLLLVETRVWLGIWDGKECLFGVCREITENEDDDQFFEILFQNNPAPMSLSSLPERRFLEVNTAFLSIFGFSKKQVIGKTALEVGICHDDATRALISERLESEGRVQNLEFHVSRADGRVIHLVYSAEIVVRSGRQYLLAMMLDITKLKEAHNNLKESEERFSLMADSAPVLLWKSGVDALCTYFNKPWIEFTGRTLEQELGNGWAEGVHPEDFERCLKIYLDSFHARRKFEMEYRLLRSDGEYRWLLDHGVPRFTETGEFLGFIGSCVDITEKKQANKQKEEALDHLLKIAESVPGVIYQFRLRPDGTSCFPFASEKMKDLYGLTPQEIRDDASIAFSRIHPDDINRIRESIIESSQQMSPWQQEFQIVFPDGRVRTLYGNSLPVREVDGSTLWHGFITDVTEKKCHESEMELLAKRLMLATKAGQIGIWEWDIPNNNLIWDDQMFHLYGITQGQFSNLYDAWEQLIHPDDLQLRKEEIMMALRGQIDFNTSFRIVWPDGTIRHIRSMGIVQRNEAGEPVRMIGSNWDITEKKLKESILSENAAYARGLFEVNMDPLLTLSIDGRITDMNEATVFATGITREQLLGTDFSGYFSDPMMARAFFQITLTEGQVRNMPLSLCHVSSRITDSLYCANVYRDSAGKPLGVFVAVHDITKSKRAESIVLEHVSRSNELAHLRSRFVSMASHELRTPLANIMLASELLKNYETKPLSPQITRSAIDGLMSSVSSMVRTIDDLLLAGKIDEGKLPFEPAPCHLLNFLKECCLEVESDGDSLSRIELLFNDTETIVSIDASLIRHVLKNILENALKYSAADTKVELLAVVSTKSLTLSVKDHGIGVPETDRKYLFDAFSRASNVSDQPGSGLGLFIAQKCAESHRGVINYEPQSDGSIFSLTIPLGATTE